MSASPGRSLLRTLPIALLAVATASVAAQGKPTADALAQSLQKRYQGIHDFSASFAHSYRGGVLRTQSQERGTLIVKKPGRMRWLYTSPEKKEFVSDGRKIYSYLPQDRQVIVSDVPADGTTPSLFLTGRGDIARDFTAAYVDPPIPGTWALKLTPRKSEPEFEHLVVAVDPSTLQIRALSTRDRQGGESTFAFSNLKENVGISDKEFAFKIPRGVDVLTNDARN